MRKEDVGELALALLLQLLVLSSSQCWATASAEQLRKWERGNATLPSKLTAALHGCQLQLHKALKHTQTVHLMEFLHWDQWSKTLHFISASTRDKSQQHYAFNVYIQTTRNLIFNTLDVKQHMVALQHSIRSDSVTHSAKIFPETLCVRLSRATLLYTQCGQPLRDSVGPLLHWRHFWRSAWAPGPGWRLIFCPNYLFYYMTDTSV